MTSSPITVWIVTEHHVTGENTQIASTTKHTHMTLSCCICGSGLAWELWWVDTWNRSYATGQPMEQVR